MPTLASKIYAHSPVWYQNLGISLYGMSWRSRRFGGVFSKEAKAFHARESFTPHQWRHYQAQALRRILRAALRAPYYKEAFSLSGFSEKNIDAFQPDDLKDLAPLEKDKIRRNPKSLIVENNPEKLHLYLTSGTTGTPMEIYFSDEMHQKWSAAYEIRCRRWAGLDNSMSRAMIGGRLVVPEANAKPPFWRYNFAEKQLYMSAFHISPENVPHYAKALAKYKPDYLVGYASAHYFLARMMQQQKLKPHRPKAVLTSSEKLTPEMREVLEKVYRCRVFDAYSGVEACCLASECDSGRMHVSPDVGIIEIVDPDGRPVKTGEVGEIVATGLLNEAQPLIRYRTGDYATLSDEKCLCGRAMPVLKELVGRLEDTVVGIDGREMVRFHGIFVGVPKIREGQVIQETLSDLRLKLVADGRLDENEERLIRGRFEERLGAVKLTIEYVDYIEKTERGKFRAVISKVQRTR
jgi:phenylacetate-CoA ligase